MVPRSPLKLVAERCVRGWTDRGFSLDEKDQGLKISELHSRVNVIAHIDPDIFIYALELLWTNLGGGGGSKPRRNTQLVPAPREAIQDRSRDEGFSPSVSPVVLVAGEYSVVEVLAYQRGGTSMVRQICHPDT